MGKIISIYKVTDMFKRKVRLQQKRKDRLHKVINNKFYKKTFRRWQKEHNGKLPDLSVIPKKTLYCYITISFDRDTLILKTKPCPYYYSVEVPKEERKDHIGIVAVGQNHIGGCHLLGKTDDDYGGWGLLWDQCKECGLSEDVNIEDMTTDECE